MVGIPVQPALSSDEHLIRKAADERRRQAIRRIIDNLIVFGVFFGSWEAVVAAGWIHPFYISRPSSIAIDLFQLFASGVIFRHLGLTLYETLGGLALGAVFGVATGFAAAFSRRVADALQPLIVALNSMPRVAIAPLFIIWFGFGPASKIALAALVVYFIMFFNTFGGMRSVDPVLKNSIFVMGGSKAVILWTVSLPFTWAWVFAAMKTSISMALIGAVVGEFVGSSSGVGWMMVQASGTLNTTRLFSLMIVLAFVGAMLFALLRMVEDHVLRWRPRTDL